MSKFEEFLAKYGELCREYNLVVSTCGCCDTPIVIAADDKFHIHKNVEQHLTHLRAKWIESLPPLAIPGPGVPS